METHLVAVRTLIDLFDFLAPLPLSIALSSSWLILTVRSNVISGRSVFVIGVSSGCKYPVCRLREQCDEVPLNSQSPY